MPVIVVNFDKSWPFASLVKQHCIDLYRPDQGVMFWNAIEDDDAGKHHRDSRDFWGDWPRWLAGNRSMLESEIINATRQAGEPGKETLVFIWVFPRVDEDWPKDILLDGPTLEAIARELDGPSAYAAPTDDSYPLLWRVGLFRDSHGLSENQIDAANKWVMDKLLDTVVLIPERETRVDTHMALLRGLVDVVQHRDARRLLRPSRAIKGDALFRCNVHPVREDCQAARARRLFIEVVNRFESDRDLQRQQRQREDVGGSATLESRFKAIITKIDDRISPKQLESRSDQSKWHETFRKTPTHADPNFVRRAGEARREFLSEISTFGFHWLEHLDREQSEGFTKVLPFENEVVGEIEALSDGLMGARGEDVIQIRRLREGLKDKIVSFREKATKHHDAILAMAREEPDSQFPGSGRTKGRQDSSPMDDWGILRDDPRLDAVRQRFEEAWYGLRNACHHLPPRRALFAWAGGGAVAIVLLLAAYASGAGIEAGSFHHWISRNPGYLMIAVAFFLSLVIAGFFMHQAVAGPVRKQAGDLQEAGAELDRQTREIYDRSLSYIDLTYDLGLLNLLDERLDDLQETLRHLDFFENERKLLGEGTESVKLVDADIDNASVQIREQMERTRRDRWIKLFLNAWPVPLRPSQLTARVGTGPDADRRSLTVESRYFLGDQTTIRITPIQTIEKASNDHDNTDC